MFCAPATALPMCYVELQLCATADNRNVKTVQIVLSLDI